MADKVSIFRYLEYRKYLKKLLDEGQKNRTRTLKNFAETIGVHPPYLTKVLKEEAHLTEDQIFFVVQTLQLNEREERYLILIHQYQRSGSKERRRALLEQIQSIKKHAFSTQHSTEIAKVIDKKSAEFYTPLFTDPMAMVFYIFLTIEKYQASPELIGQELKLSESKANSIIKKLLDEKLARSQTTTGRLIVEHEYAHMARDSLLKEAWLKLSRVQALEHLSRVDEELKHGFSMTFSANKEVFEGIKENFSRFLKDTANLVDKSEEEGVYQLNFDLFQWKL